MVFVKQQEDKFIKINIILNNVPLSRQPGIYQDQRLITRKSIKGFDLSGLVKVAFNHYKIPTGCDVKVDYWSAMTQSFIICGEFDPSSIHFLPKDELLSNGEKSCIILRFSNCTGNVIDLSELSARRKPTEDQLKKAKAALSIDDSFKS